MPKRNAQPWKISNNTKFKNFHSIQITENRFVYFSHLPAVKIDDIHTPPSPPPPPPLPSSVICVNGARNSVNEQFYLKRAAFLHSVPLKWRIFCDFIFQLRLNFSSRICASYESIVRLNSRHHSPTLKYIYFRMKSQIFVVSKKLKDCLR